MKEKKLDDIEIFHENPDDIFRPILTLQEVVKKFHDDAVESMKSKRWKKLRLQIADFPKIFHYTYNPKEGTTKWLPRRYRDECVRQGITLFKIRGRDYVEVTIDESVKFTEKKKKRPEGLKYEMKPVVHKESDIVETPIAEVPPEIQEEREKRKEDGVELEDFDDFGDSDNDVTDPEDIENLLKHYR